MAKPAKPDSFDKTRLDPAFEALFDKAWMVVPCWEGEGTSVVDLVSGESGTIIGTTPAQWGDDTEDGGALDGVHLDAAGMSANGGVDFSTTSRATKTYQEMSVVAVYETTENPSEEAYIFTHGDEDCEFMIRNGGRPWFEQGGTRIQPSITVNDGVTHVIQAFAAAAGTAHDPNIGEGVSLRVDDGAWFDAPSPYAASEATPSTGPMLLRASWNTYRPAQGKLRAMYVFDVALTEAEFDAIVANPYGLIDMTEAAPPITVQFDPVGNRFAGSDVLLSVQAESSEGTITSVSFRNTSDDSLVGVASYNAGEDRWQYTIEGIAEASYDIYADVEDSEENTSTSAKTTFTVTALQMLHAFRQATHDTIAIAGELSHEGADARINVYSDDGFTTLVAQSAAGVDSEALEHLRFVSMRVSGLNPGTTYYCKVELEGVEADNYEIEIETLPAPGTPTNFTYAFGNDIGTGQDGTGAANNVFSRILARSPIGFVLMGGHHTEQSSSVDTPATYVAGFKAMLDTPEQAAVWESVPIWSNTDDQGLTGHATEDGNDPVLPYGQEAWRTALPWIGIPDPAEMSGSFYYSFVHGRVRFIVLDAISEKNVGSSEYSISPTQEAWLESEVQAAKAAGQGIVLCSGHVWIQSSGDGWGDHATQRTRIADMILDEEMEGRIIMLNGSMHALAADDGTNNTYGTEGSLGFPVAIAGAIDDGSFDLKGGPYSEGVDGGPGHYGILEVSDGGGSTLTITLTGYDENDDVAYTVSQVMEVGEEPVEVGQDQTASATASAYAASVSHEPLTASQDATASTTASAYDASAASQQSIEAAQDQTASASTGAYAASVTTSPLEAAQGATARATTSAYSASAGTGVRVAAAQDATASATSTAYAASVTTEAKTASQDAAASALATAFAALVSTEPKTASQDGTATATATAYAAIAGAAAKRATQDTTASATASAYAGAVSTGPAVTATQAQTASATASAYAAAVALGTPVTASQDQAARAATGAYAASVLFVDTSEILSTVEVALRDALTLNTALQDALTLTAKLGD